VRTLERVLGLAGMKPVAKQGRYLRPVPTPELPRAARQGEESHPI
jgi:hypothetical protein